MKKSLPGRWLILIPAMFAAFALVTVACGGGGGSGSDEDYVKAVCDAGNKFDEQIEDAQPDTSDNVSEEDALKIFAEPFSDFASALDKANPPSDMKDAHDQLVDGLKTLAEKLEDGDLTAFENAGDTLNGFEPPQDVQDRLNAVAENVSACEGSNFFN